MGNFLLLTTPPLYVCLTWKEDANTAWSPGVRLMFCGDKIMVNYSPGLILWWVRDGNTSWCWCLTALEGHVNASQLLGDPEHRANGHPVCAGMFLSRATLSFTANDDIKWAVCQNSGGPGLIYGSRQSGRSVTRHPLRGSLKESNVTWCQGPRCSKKALSDSLQIHFQYSSLVRDSWSVRWY